MESHSRLLSSGSRGRRYIKRDPTALASTVESSANLTILLLMCIH